MRCLVSVDGGENVGVLDGVAGVAQAVGSAGIEAADTNAVDVAGAVRLY